MRYKFSPYLLPAAIVIVVLTALNYFPAAAAACLVSIAAAVLVVLLFICKKEAKPLFLISLAALAVAAASFLIYMSSVNRLAPYVGTKCVVTAVVSDSPTAVASGSLAIPLKTETVNGAGVKVGLALYASGCDELEIGDRITFEGKLKSTSLSANLGGGKGYPYSVTVYDSRKIEFGGQSDNLRYYIGKLRGYCRETIERFVPAEYAPVVKGVALGDKSGLDYRIKSVFRATGASHVMAVSGLHVSLVAGFIMFVCMALGLGRRGTSAIVLLFVAVFTAIAGFTPSAVRAAIMTVVTLMSFVFLERAAALNSLFFAVALILIVSPYSACDLRLQLSAAACFGIVLLSDDFSKGINNNLFRSGKNKAARFASASLGVSLAAMVFVLPLSMIYFEQVSLLAPLSMLLISFLVSAVLVLALALVIFAFVSPFAVLLGALAGWAAKLILQILELLAKAPFALVSLDYTFCAPLLLFLFVLFAAYYIYREKGIKARYLFVAFALALTVGVFTAKPLYPFLYSDRYAIVSFVDVGQGDCTVISRGGSAVIVDAGGGSGEYAFSAISAELVRLGVGRIEAMIVTHLHEDHANAVELLLENNYCDKLYMPDIAKKPDIMERIERLCEENGVELVHVSNDIKIDTGVAEFEIFADHIDFDEASDQNEFSLVIKTGLFGSKFLVTGDLDRHGELELLRSGADIDVDCLRAAHHGSDTSSSELFLSKATPAISVVSVGSNPYGLPDDDAMLRIEEYSDYIFTTAEEGTIDILVSEKGMEVLG